VCSRSARNQRSNMSTNDESSTDMLDLFQPSRQDLSLSTLQVSEPGHSSSSWKMLQTRATSFPHIRSVAQTNPPNDNYQNGKTGGIPIWTSALQNRQTKGMNPFVTLSPTHSPTPTRPQKRPTMRRTPVLTLTLLKLDDCLSEFCKILEDPTYNNVQKACGILDSSVATASTGMTAFISSGKNSCDASKSPERTSPSLSPISLWFSGGALPTDTSPISSAVALEGEWETFCNPLIVFAGLEGIYASLSHAESSELAWSLSKLYEKTASDIIVVRETLCDPFLSSENDGKISKDASGSTKLSSYKEKAFGVAMALESIVNVCQCRDKLIWQQRDLWTSTDSITLPSCESGGQSSPRDANSGQSSSRS
jgi:hypothetical protein